MQIVDKKNIEKRILFYCSKMYVQSIKSGTDYIYLEKSIAILISDYEIESLKEIKKYVSKWNFRKEDYGNLILTDAIEVYIIELSKFEKYMNNTALADWIKFIINPKVIDMSNEEVKKAKKVLDEISQDTETSRLAELREKYIMDQKAVEAAGYDKGLECGLKQGLEQGLEYNIPYNIPYNVNTIKKGIEQGIASNKLETAKKMKSQGFDANTICKITDLSIDEINNL